MHSSEITTKEDFARYGKQVEAGSDYQRPEAFGFGVCRMDGEVLDVKFFSTNVRENYGSITAVTGFLQEHDINHGFVNLLQGDWEELLAVFSPFEGESGHHNIEALHSCRRLAEFGLDPYDRQLMPVVCSIKSLDDPPKDVVDAWLRLYLLSQRKVQPNSINLEGLFGLLRNLAWTNKGPFSPEFIHLLQDQFFIEEGEDLQVRSVDKFPRMTDYVVPSGVRIADADRVRLGAHLAEGTTVMHEGFVNFNAGTLGISMVEGRISAGVVVGDGTDIGGGASIMGTLSGGGTEIISVGKGCLLGANSGIGISLGDNCVVEAGLYLTAGMMVTRSEDRLHQVKASELSGESNLLFRRHSVSGRVEVLPRDTPAVELNEELHTN